MNILLRLIISAALFMLAALLLAEGIVRNFDGEVFDLPNHKLLIKDNGFHFYKISITHEWKEAEE